MSRPEQKSALNIVMVSVSRIIVVCGVYRNVPGMHDVW